jgi:hypothetical protein
MAPTMGKTNAAWHRAHRMPARATIDQRVAWHLEHAAHCACRPVPESIRAALRARGLAVPPTRAQGPSARR